MGETVAVTLNQSTKDATAGADGHWRVQFEPMKAGGPYLMGVSGKNNFLVKDIYVGEVWLASGQSNMEMTVAAEDRYWCGVINERAEVESANYPQIRMFKVKLHMTDTAQEDIDGQWNVTTPETVKKYSAAGYFFARALYEKLHVPIGIIDSTFGASTAQAWISSQSLEAHSEFAYLEEAYNKAKVDFSKDAAERDRKYEEAMKVWTAEAARVGSEGKFLPKQPNLVNPQQNQHNPSVLFNGMIAPLASYALRGVIWYQGESNEDQSVHVYRQLMETLVSDWRRRWGIGNFPFLYVQLASLHTLALAPPTKAPIAMVREAQLQNLSIPNSAMVVTIDIGDADNVHPKNKQEVGRRLGLAARALAYDEQIEYSGPIEDSIKINGDSIVVHFTNCKSGLHASGGTPIGFAVAGEDKHFVWATAKIEGDTVVVSSETRSCARGGQIWMGRQSPCKPV